MAGITGLQVRRCRRCDGKMVIDRDTELIRTHKGIRTIRHRFECQGCGTGLYLWTAPWLAFVLATAVGATAVAGAILLHRLVRDEQTLIGFTAIAGLAWMGAARELWKRSVHRKAPLLSED